MKNTQATSVQSKGLKEKEQKERGLNQIKQALKDAQKGIFGKGLFAF